MDVNSLVLNQETSFYAKATNITVNKQASVIALVLEDKSGQVRARASIDLVEIIKKDMVYLVTGTLLPDEYKPVFKITKLRPINYQDNVVYSDFFKVAPISKEELEVSLRKYYDSISSVELITILEDCFKEYGLQFMKYPAATTYHHSYVLGLAYHTLTMLNIASNICNLYTYLNRDLVYAGIFMHDLAKVVEFSSEIAPEYTLKGKLIGHLVMGSELIEEAARKYGLEDNELVILLKHIVLSHHGRPDFGACKKPQIAEAEVIHLIDTIDSKMEVLREVYLNNESGEFSPKLAALEGRQFYIHKGHLDAK